MYVGLNAEHHETSTQGVLSIHCSTAVHADMDSSGKQVEHVGPCVW